MKNKGMTLVELLVVLAILSIIAGLSYNTFKSFRIESQREEAKTALLQASVWVDKYLVENNVVSIDGVTLPAEFNSDNYELALTSSATSGSIFIVSAEAKSDSPQVNDTGCTTLTIEQNGTKAPEECW